MLAGEQSLPVCYTTKDRGEFFASSITPKQEVLVTDPDVAKRIEDYIRQAYERLKQIPGFHVNREQPRLSYAIAICLVNNTPFIGEAPTGTGKTIAYSIGALAAAHVLKEDDEKPIVFATGTKALQDQIMTNDLPKLVSVGIIPAGIAALAKGRSNFFCAHAADEIVAQSVMDFDEEPDEEEADEEAILERQLSPDEVEPLLSQFDLDMWDGDFDHYSGSLPKPLTQIKVTAETCLGRKCPRYDACPFFKMKKKLEDASIIVTNHDLVMIDLKVAQESEPYFPIKDYLLIVDEGHELPEKAIAVGSTEVNLNVLRAALDKFKHFRNKVWSHGHLVELMTSKNLKMTDFDVNQVLPPMTSLIKAIESIQVTERDSYTKRFPRGVIPEQLGEVLDEAYKPLEALGDKLALALDALDKFRQEGENGNRKDVMEAIGAGLAVDRFVSEGLKAILAFNRGEDLVKWVYIKDTRVALHTSPLEGAQVLKPLLWEAKEQRARTAVVSATVRDVNGFGRFITKSGMPPGTRTLTLPHTFPYHESTLTVVNMKATPKPAQRAQFIEELSQKVPEYVNRKEATLVLFPSFVLMKAMVPVLRAKFGEEVVLVQRDAPMKQLLSKHCARVDNGKFSMLCGLQTMAQGLDLPDKYCEHVMIMAIPFAVPSDPVEQEIAEILGDRYFSERSLPDAAIRLAQMVGRLLRRFTDRGRVTIFDSRLASTGYGRQILDFLPPFTKVIERQKAAA
jgi:ATP-dependent DNA helicase DinG